jgi:hypothetical protein
VASAVKEDVLIDLMGIGAVQGYNAAAVTGCVDGHNMKMRFSKDKTYSKSIRW